MNLKTLAVLSAFTISALGQTNNVSLQMNTGSREVTPRSLVFKTNQDLPAGSFINILNTPVTNPIVRITRSGASFTGDYLDIVDNLGVIAVKIDVNGDYIGNNVNIAASSKLSWTGRSQVTSASDGTVLFRNAAGTDFTMIQLGGTSASFPGIKRSAAGVQIRTASDSAYATLKALSVTLPSGTGWFEDGSGNSDLKASGYLTLGSTNAARWKIDTGTGDLIGIGTSKIYGSTVAGGDLYLEATTHATKTGATAFINSLGGPTQVGNTAATFNFDMYAAIESHNILTSYLLAGKTDYPTGLVSVTPSSGTVIIGDVSSAVNGTQISVNDSLGSITLTGTSIALNAGSVTGLIDTQIPGMSLKTLEEKEIFPQQVDGTGATLDPTPTSPTYGSVIFSGSLDEASNYAYYRFAVPIDHNTGVAWRAMLKFRLNAADTGKHAYKMAMADITDSASADAPTFINSVNLFFAGDALGASGDEETVSYTSLASWAAALTPGHTVVVRLSRDGDDGTNDTSSVSSAVRNVYLQVGHLQ